MTDSFASILDTPMDTVEKPKPHPVGQYTAVIEQSMEFGKSKNETDFVRLSLKLLQIGDDVDPADVEAKGGPGSILGKTVRATFYLTPDSLFRFKDFAENKVGVSVAGKSLRQLCSELPGHQLLLTLKHVPTTDKQDLIAVVDENAFSAI